MFDSHCHLDWIQPEQVRQEQMRSARERGVRGWLIPGCYRAQWETARAVAQQERDVWLACGYHPWWAHELGSFPQAVQELDVALRSFQARAVGECGLDALRQEKLSLAQQALLFEEQIRLAEEHELPLIVHQVRAQELFLRCFQRVGVPRAGVVVHGFSGKLGWAEELARRGFFLGIGRGLLRPERRALREVGVQLPLSRLLVETDDLGESGSSLSQLTEVIQVLAELRAEPVEQVGAELARQARALYRLEEKIAASSSNGS